MDTQDPSCVGCGIVTRTQHCLSLVCPCLGAGRQQFHLAISQVGQLSLGVVDIRVSQGKFFPGLGGDPLQQRSVLENVLSFRFDEQCITDEEVIAALAEEILEVVHLLSLLNISKQTHAQYHGIKESETIDNIARMQQSSSQMVKDIQRSLDRLTTVSKNSSLGACLPALHYSANLLQKYSQQPRPHQAQLFGQFHNILTTLTKQEDMGQLKQHQQLILNSILVIADSSAFQNCMLSRQGQPSSDSLTMALLQAQLEQLWSRIQKTYIAHKIDEAYRLAHEYMSKADKKVTVSQQKRKLIDTINLEYQTMVGFYSQFDKGSWQFDKQENGITLEYKVYEEEKQVAIRIHGEFDIPLEPFLTILSQIDLMGEYVPFCYDCKEMKVISRNQRIGTSKVYVPLLSDREAFFYAAGYDRIQEKGSIFLFSKTINTDQVYQKKYEFQVPPQGKLVRLQYLFFIVEYTPVTKTRAKIRLASKVDTKMDYMPLFILNKSARVFAFDYFNNIIKIANNYEGSKWQLKAQEKPDLYAFFKEVVAEFCAKIDSGK